MGVSLKTRREAGRLFPLTAANVWCRSVNSSNNNNFCLVNTDGSANNNNANNSWALAPLILHNWVKRSNEREPDPCKRKDTSLAKA